MRPYLEKLPQVPGISWSWLNRRLDDAIPFQWHHHPEYELTLTLNSRGQRFIGDHVGEYRSGDLILVGPNLPHTWVSGGKDDESEPHVALVLWFHPDWAANLTHDFIEFAPIAALLARAGRGLRFSPGEGARLRPRIEALFRLPPTERTLALLGILADLEADAGAEPLASAPVTQEGQPESRERIDKVLTYIHTNYMRRLTLEELAEVAALSVSGLHRLFRKHTQSTITDYVGRLRIGDACARLSATRQPVRHVAEAVGYNSLANFNRQFRRAKAMTPRQYRARFVAP